MGSFWCRENIFLRKYLHSSCCCWDVSNAKGSVSSLGHALHGRFSVRFLLGFFKGKHQKYLPSPPPGFFVCFPGLSSLPVTMTGDSPKPRCTPAPPHLAGGFSAGHVKAKAFLTLFPGKFHTLNREILEGFLLHLNFFIAFSFLPAVAGGKPVLSTPICVTVLH